MYINFPIKFKNRILSLRIHFEVKKDKYGKKNLLLTVNKNEQGHLTPDEIRSISGIFKDTLIQKTKSPIIQDSSDSSKTTYLFIKKLDIRTAIQILIDQPALDKSDEETRKTLKVKYLPNKIKVKKQKNGFFSEEIFGDPRNRFYEARRNNKSYIVRYQHDSSIAAISAFASYVCRLAIGEEHTAKTHFMTDLNNSYLGIFSKKISIKGTLHTLASTNQLPDLDALIEGGLIEILVALWAFADNDGHPNNIFIDEKGKLVLFDYNCWFYILTCLARKLDPNKPYQIGGIVMLPPNKSFPITVRDMKLFPFIKDAMPFWWILYPREFTDEKGTVKNIVVDFLKGLEKKPEVKYRAYRAFLRIALMQKHNIISFAEANFRRKERADKYVELCMKRINMIREGLRQIEDEEHFFANNPKVATEVLARFETYNKGIKDKDEDFRANLDLTRERLTYFFKPDEVRLDSARKSLKTVELKFKALKEKYNQDSREMFDFRFDVSAKLKKFKCHLEKRDVSIDEIQDDIETLHTEIDLVDKNLLNISAHIDKTIHLRNKINIICLFCRLSTEKDLTDKIMRLLADLDSLSSDPSKLVLAVKQLHYSQLRLQAIDVKAVFLTKNMLLSFFNYRPDKDQKPVDLLIDKITSFLKTSHTDLSEKYPDTSLHEIYRLWFKKIAIEKHNELRDQLSLKPNKSLNYIKINILNVIEKLLDLPNEKTSNNIKIEIIFEINDVLRAIEGNQTGVQLLKNEIEVRLKKGTNNDFRTAVLETFKEHGKVFHPQVFASIQQPFKNLTPP